MSTFRYRVTAVGAGILLVAASLTGCAPTPPALQAQAAEQLRAGVLAVTTAAAAGDYAGAQTALGSVQADLLEAASAEEVTSARSAEIQAAINLVGADLAAAIAAATPPPAPPSDDDDTEEDEGNGNNGNGNGNGNGNNGNGNGNGGPSTPTPPPVPTEEPTTEPTEPPASDDPGAEPTPDTDG